MIEIYKTESGIRTHKSDRVLQMLISIFNNIVFVMNLHSFMHLALELFQYQNLSLAFRFCVHMQISAYLD